MKFNMIKNKLFQGVAVFTGVLSSVTAFASPTGPDFSQITSNISFSTVVTAIMAVAVLVATVYIAWAGAKMVLAAIKRA